MALCIRPDVKLHMQLVRKYLYNMYKNQFFRVLTEFQIHNVTKTSTLCLKKLVHVNLHI